MTVKDVIIEAAYLVGEDEFAKAAADGRQTDADETATFLRCYNLVLHETAVEYKPIRRVATVQGGKVIFSALGDSVLRVVGAYDENGVALAYKTFPSYAVFPSGKATVVFDVAPSDAALGDEFVYDGTRIGKRVFAFGVASEYCFVKGRYSEAENFARKYRDGAEGAPATRGKSMRAVKRWGL